jgi:hypothetical protein
MTRRVHSGYHGHGYGHGHHDRHRSHHYADHDHHRPRRRYKPIPKKPHDDDADADKDYARTSKKHPEAIHIDQSTEAERTRISSTLSFVKQNKQQDVYSTFRADQESHLIASIDFVGRKTEMIEIGNIFHEVDQVDVITAGTNASKSKVDDAGKYLEALVDKVVSAASKTGAPLPKITLVGHASYTAHEKIDRIKDAKGNIREIAHNPWLAEQRAENTRKYMEAIAKQKYPEFMKKHPHLFSPEHVKTEAKGDSELLVATKKEANPNRRTAIQMQSETVNDDERLYRVYHMKRDEAEALIYHGVTRTYDLAKNTSLGNSLMSSDSRIKVPARGSLLLEDVAYQGRLNLKVLVAEPDDFRVLVPKTAGNASYVINRDGSFSVWVNGKESARIRVEMPNGQPIQAQDVIVASVDWKKGDDATHEKEMVAKTKPVQRDRAREAKVEVAYARFVKEEGIKAEKLAAQREQDRLCAEEERQKADIAAREQAARDAAAKERALKEQTARREGIYSEIDKNHDGAITKDEFVAYRKMINTMRSLDGRAGLTAEEVAKKIQIREKSNPEMAARFEAMLKAIGSADGQGHITVSKEQITAAIQKRDEFDAMLADGKFQAVLKGDALAVADVIDKSGNKRPATTSNVSAGDPKRTL